MKKCIVALIGIVLLLGCALLLMGRSRDTPERPAVSASPQPTTAQTSAPTEAPRLEIDPNAGAQITPAPTMPGIAIPR